MTFLDHSVAWLRGEVLEMSILAGAGALILAIAGGLWRFAPTPLGQALPIPLAAIAVLFLTVGLIGSFGMAAKVATFTAAFDADPAAFVRAEKVRVAAFQVLYTYTMIGAAVGFVIALTIFALTVHPMLRAIAVSLVFLGLSGLVIDMFSQERAKHYSGAIEAEITRIN